ncbi:MAG TPA: hypothetical protein VNB06_05185 [Thermoanaerobaculia bacterium]|nr:hypothetical protein [Thermoanaerobaculia bacterium]
MANEMDPRFVSRLRLAGVLVILGLLVQLATLLEAHPYSFLSFLIGGTGLVLAGVVTFVWAWARQ